MNANVKRKLEKGEREQQFMVDNAGDFVGGVGATAAAEQAVVIAEIHTLSGEQVSGESTSAQMVANQDDLLDQLIAFLKLMNLAANAFKDIVPGSDTKFRMPRNRAHHALLATARAFHDDAIPLTANFVAYGFSATFVADLQKLIDDIEAASDTADSGTASRAAATGGLKDAAKRLMEISRKLNSIVRIRYADNAKQLAAWTVASHLEKAPKSKKTKTETPT